MATVLWQQLGLDIDGETAGDQSGFSVSLSVDGTYVAIGAPFNNSNIGHIKDDVDLIQFDTIPDYSFTEMTFY